jgi:glucokinase
VNSKQIVAAVSVAVLVVILVYPALSTSNVTVLLRSTKIDKADHVYVTISSVWAHQQGQPASSAWQLISNITENVDLISLENTTLTSAKQQIPVGGYDSVRLEISNVTWVFNRTTTRLSVQSSQVETILDFTAQAGRETTITLVLSGHMEEVGGTQLFASNLTATLGEVTGP